MANSSTDPDSTSSFESMLRKAGQGNQKALNAVWEQVYESIKQIASRQMARELDGGLLQTTAIVHEAYFRMSAQNRSTWQSKGDFLMTASTMIRRTLIDEARKRKAEKRGGDRSRSPQDPITLPVADQSFEVLEIHEALDKLAESNVDCAQVMEMAVFGGLTSVQIAEALDTSKSTVDRRLRFARAWLRKILLESDS